MTIPDLAADEVIVIGYFSQKSFGTDEKVSGRRNLRPRNRGFTRQFHPILQLRTIAMTSSAKVFVPASEGDDFEPRNHLEVTHICGGHAVAKLQGGNPDQQVGEGDTDAL